MSKLASDIECFLSRHGMSPTHFGHAAVGDGAFAVDVIKKGRNPRVDTAEKVMAFMAQYDAEHPPAAPVTEAAADDPAPPA